MTAFIDKLALITLKDNKVLAVRSYGKSLFYMPGGKREQNETDEEALIREITEELSVQIKPESIRYAATFEAQADGKPIGTVVRLTCYFADFDDVATASAEIEELRYLSSADLNVCSKAAELVVNWLLTEKLIN